MVRSFFLLLPRAHRIGRALSRSDGGRVLALGQKPGHEALALGDSLDLYGNGIDCALDSFQSLSSFGERLRRQTGSVRPSKERFRKADRERTQDENDRDNRNRRHLARSQAGERGSASRARDQSSRRTGQLLPGRREI